MRRSDMDEMTSQAGFQLGEIVATEARAFFLGYMAGCGGPREPGGEVQDLAAAVTLEYAKLLMLRVSLPTPSVLRAAPNGVVGPLHRAN